MQQSNDSPTSESATPTDSSVSPGSKEARELARQRHRERVQSQPVLQTWDVLQVLQETRKRLVST